MRTLFALGRIVFGGFVVASGLKHLAGYGKLTAEAATKGVRVPNAAVSATAAMLVTGGLSVVAGVRPRRGLAMLIAFLVPESLQMHRFWETDNQERRANELAHFMKNMALVGAALALMQVDEPWPVSLDGAQHERDELYVRVGSREIRALPY